MGCRLAEISKIRDQVADDLEAQGAGGVSDVTLSEGWRGQALLAEHAARLRRDLAVDAHQDRFGDRLDTASFPRLA